MGFTFLMDANTSKKFYNYFMGVKQTLISHWKMKKISGIERLVLPFPDTWKYLCLLLLHKHPLGMVNPTVVQIV